jgi:hypothetical protein
VTYPVLSRVPSTVGKNLNLKLRGNAVVTRFGITCVHDDSLTAEYGRIDGNSEIDHNRRNRIIRDNHGTPRKPWEKGHATFKVSEGLSTGHEAFFRYRPRVQSRRSSSLLEVKTHKLCGRTTENVWHAIKYLERGCPRKIFLKHTDQHASKTHRYSFCHCKRQQTRCCP